MQVFDKVRKVVKALPVAHIEVDGVVTSGWECGEVEGKHFSKRIDFPPFHIGLWERIFGKVRNIHVD